MPSTPDVLGDPRLTWAPPALHDPQTVAVTEDNTKLELDPNVDYVIALPPRPVAAPTGLHISGGHDVVVIGGTVDVPSGAQTGKTHRNGLYLQDWTGTMHVEGLLLEGDLQEGISTLR